MAEMLTQTLELVKVPSFNPGIIGSSSNYVVRCTKCGRTQEINADFWKDYVQHKTMCNIHIVNIVISIKKEGVTKRKKRAWWKQSERIAPA